MKIQSLNLELRISSTSLMFLTYLLISFFPNVSFPQDSKLDFSYPPTEALFGKKAEVFALTGVQLLSYVGTQL